MLDERVSLTVSEKEHKLISILRIKERLYLPSHVGFNLCVTSCTSILPVSLLEEETDEHHVENLCLSAGRGKLLRNIMSLPPQIIYHLSHH